MARPNLFQQLTRLFRSGPIVKRKVRSLDTTIVVPDRLQSSGAMLMQKSASNIYANITMNAYNINDRMMRYSDFQEMEMTPELAAALDLYADETVSPDEKNKVLHVNSDNEKMRQELYELFYGVLNVEFNLRSWVRNLCKYGDLMCLLDVHPKHGVVGAHPVPVHEIEREEGFDPNDPWAVRFKWSSLGNRYLENWEIAHFRLMGNDAFLPYGSSVVDAARRIWRQLILAEDAMLVYRVTRAPERRVHYIDVGNLSPNEVEAHMEEQKRMIRTSSVVDNNTGRVDMRYNPFSIDEDYWIAVRGQETATRVETLAGGQNTAAVEDVAYLRDKLFTALKIPKAYLGYSDGNGSKASLAQLDIRFSRTIQSIQKVVVSELNKIAIVHLYALGYSGDELLNFTLNLSNPSTVATQQKLELWRSRFEIAATAPENMASRRFMRETIFGLTQDECEQIDNDRYDEKIIDAALEDANSGVTPDDGSPGGGGGGSGGGSDDLGDDFPDLEDAGTDDADAGSDEPEPETAGKTQRNDLLVASVDHDEPSLDELIDNIDTTKLPSKIAKHVQYNRSRIRHHGASKTHTPDFVRMTGNDTPSTSDPFDKTWMKSVVTNPLADNKKQDSFKPLLTSDIVRTLNLLEQRIRPLGNNHVIVETNDEKQTEINYDDGTVLDIED